MIFAAILVIIAGGILYFNTSENNRVEEESITTITEIENLIDQNNALLDAMSEQNNSAEITLRNVDINEAVGAKASTKVNGVTYIGIVYIPSLNNLAVPVIDTCTESNLKISACRYVGTLEENNIVIAGHNYKSLFGKLNKLSVGNILYFKDLEGNAHKYKCVEILTLNENDVEKMQTGNWDLTLFTCTYRGNQRLTYRFEITN